jgi:soluble lytic murein transglycosylase-like protein
MRLAFIGIVPAGSLFGQSAAAKQRASVALQQASVRKQAESAGIVPPGTRPRNVLAPECDAVAEEVVAPLIDGVAKAQKLQPKLLRAVIERESAFRPSAVSPVGAQGLMQLMPATADEIGVDNPCECPNP